MVLLRIDRHLAFIQNVLTNKKNSCKLSSEFFYRWVGQVHVIIIQLAMLLALCHRGKFICKFRSVKFLFVSTIIDVGQCFGYQTLSCWCCTIHPSKKILRLQVKPCGNSSMFGLLLLPQWLVQPLRWLFRPQGWHHHFWAVPLHFDN